MRSGNFWPLFNCLRKRKKVIIEERRMDQSIWIKLRDKYLNYEEITVKKKASISEKGVPWVIPPPLLFLPQLSNHTLALSET